MYLFLSQKVHVSKILFHPKISPINMAMHPLFAVPASRTKDLAAQRMGRTPPAVASYPSLRPYLPLLYFEEVGGGWSYIFFVFPNFYFLYHGRGSIPFFITDSIAQWLRR
jgi:hypothetical protein